MASFINGLRTKKESKASIRHILKPKWLGSVRVERFDGFFKITMWDSDLFVPIYDSNKFSEIHKSPGNWSKREVNLLGEHKIEYTTKINWLDVNQCFSLSKPILINRISKMGDGSGEYFVRYEEDDHHGILLSSRDGIVVIHSDIALDEELVINNMAISIKDGPIGIMSKYGRPDVKLTLSESDNYCNNKTVYVSSIRFYWGNSGTKYSIIYNIDVVNKSTYVEIVVR